MSVETRKFLRECSVRIGFVDKAIVRYERAHGRLPGRMIVSKELHDDLAWALSTLDAPGPCTFWEDRWGKVPFTVEEGVPGWVVVVL